MNFQLLTPIENPQRYLEDDRWLAQPKYDGQRMRVHLGGYKTTRAYSRTERETRDLLPPQPVRPAIVDAEVVDGTVIAFDLLEWGFTNFRTLPYQERLESLPAAVAGTPVKVTITARSTEEKAKLYLALTELKAEGIVFKAASARWYRGRRDEAVKYKFVSTITGYVLRHNTKRSVAVGLAGPSGLVDVGNVTIPPSRDVPPLGALIEVRYLYAVPGSMKLVQPVFLKVRDDVPVDSLTQLRPRGSRK